MKFAMFCFKFIFTDKLIFKKTCKLLTQHDWALFQQQLKIFAYSRVPNNCPPPNINFWDFFQSPLLFQSPSINCPKSWGREFIICPKCEPTTKFHNIISVQHPLIITFFKYLQPPFIKFSNMSNSELFQQPHLLDFWEFCSPHLFWLPQLFSNPEYLLLDLWMFLWM